MRDSVLKRAILISIAVHLVAISFIGRTSSTRLSAASIIPAPQRLLNVDLVKDPLAEPPKPKPVARPDTAVLGRMSNPIPTIADFVAGHHTRHPAALSHPSGYAPNAGGPLNTGTNDLHGDLEGNWGGTTPVGGVPGSEAGRGSGSGSEPGVGSPEPVRNDAPRHQAPPPPPPAPAPKRVVVRICELSGLLAGPYCQKTRSATFNEGDEPKRICDRCKAPEPPHNSRIADRHNPVLVKDVRPQIPDSVDEGLTLEVEIEYYVDTDGGVSSVRITKSSGNRDLDRAVTSAASQWRYDPAVQDGVARRVKVARTIKFKT
jgi:TonB family protein